MQPHADTETHRTPEVEPAIKHTVPWRVKAVTALPDARLQVVFVTASEVHMKQFLSDSRLNGTIFGSLRDPAVFAQVQVVLGAVQWSNGADLAPDAMYDAIREDGRWVL
jgi:hypothetical protein